MATDGRAGKGALKLVHCAICKREITSVHIKCAACTDVDLCAECFGMGSESKDVPHHLATHPYRVMDNLAGLFLYDREWSAKEELMLLDGIEMYGFGNWRDIANFVGTKSEQQCHKHYLAVYIDSPTSPLPCAPGAVNVAKPEAGSGGVGSGGGPAAVVGSGARTAPSSSHGSGTPGYSNAHIPKTDVVGYMPLRGDFDIEYDNDAEAILADMDFVEGEHATETELKLKILQIYNAKLDEREKRKTFIIERGLLEYKRLLAVERRRPREEREIYDLFRPFARFMTAAEHEELLRGVILETRLRKRIAQLNEYRKLGIKSLAEAHEYEASKRKKDNAPGARRGGVGAAGSSSTTGGPGAVSTTSTTASDDGMTARSNRYSRRGGGVEEGAPGGTTGDASTPEDASTTAATGTKRRRPGEAGVTESGSDEEGPFSLEGVPGADRLTAEERRVCEHLRLLPMQYWQIKATIINIALVRGHVKPSDASATLVHVDAAKVNGVYDFCITAGWVKGVVHGMDDAGPTAWAP